MPVSDVQKRVEGTEEESFWMNVRQQNDGRLKHPPFRLPAIQD